MDSRKSIDVSYEEKMAHWKTLSDQARKDYLVSARNLAEKANIDPMIIALDWAWRGV